MSNEAGHPPASTPSVLQTVETTFADHFGHRPQRASVSFLGVDPIEVLRFEPIPGERAYLSLGMARHPMTGGAESFVATDGPRAELMLHLHDPTDEYADIWRRVGLLAAAPAVESVVYAAGLTVDLGEPLVPGSACTGVVVTASPLSTITTSGGDVEVFQIVPATSNELAWARVHGTEELLTRLHAPEVDLLDLLRRSVPLD